MVTIQPRIVSCKRATMPRHGSSILISRLTILTFIATLALTSLAIGNNMFISDTQIESLVVNYTASHNNADRERFEQGVRQVAGMWSESDGDLAAFNAFCSDNFISDPTQLRQTADRLEAAFESIDGHLVEMDRDLSWYMDIEAGPILPIDYVIASYSPWAHLDEDMFASRIAFSVLLNFPVYSLDDMLRLGSTWSREQWAQARLARRFTERVPAEVSQTMQKAFMSAGNYIRDYNIWMHHLIDNDGNRPFPKGLKLISHWNLRDELKAQYGETDGLAKQEMIYDVMSKIIRQQIPRAVINNPTVDWRLATNDVFVTKDLDADVLPPADQKAHPGDYVKNTAEPDIRYEQLLGIFHAQQLADQYYPSTPTLIERRFQRYREIPEAEVQRLFESILASEEIARTGKLIEKRLGRKLRPFDIWYDGFKTRSTISEDKLDSMTRAKYPTPDAFKADMPRILTQLGFDANTAQFIASRVEVDPSRGAGHASGPGRRVDNAHLRTRVQADGMDYKGYNIAVHEFGHNVEQVFSTSRIDHPLLAGVPNTAFTEAFAFIFQDRDLELLGIPDTDPNAEHLRALDDLWGTYEIAGVSLVDMKVWHWMYDHPNATAPQLKDATIAIAKDVWNQYFAPVFGIEDVDLLAIYSHMISSAMYLPDYPLGQIISFQIEQYFKTRNLGTEMERMCKQGSITPGLWMQKAVGSDISTEPMLEVSRKALNALGA